MIKKFFIARSFHFEIHLLFFKESRPFGIDNYLKSIRNESFVMVSILGKVRQLFSIILAFLRLYYQSLSHRKFVTYAGKLIRHSIVFVYSI